MQEMKERKELKEREERERDAKGEKKDEKILPAKLPAVYLPAIMRCASLFCLRCCIFDPSLYQVEIIANLYQVFAKSWPSLCQVDPSSTWLHIAPHARLAPRKIKEEEVAQGSQQKRATIKVEETVKKDVNKMNIKELKANGFGW